MTKNKKQFIKTLLYIQHLITSIKWLIIQNNITKAEEKLREANSLIEEVGYDNTWWKRNSVTANLVRENNTTTNGTHKRNVKCGYTLCERFISKTKFFTKRRIKNAIWN